MRRMVIASHGRVALFRFLQSPDADPDDDSTVQQFFAVQSFSSWKAFAMPRLIA